MQIFWEETNRSVRYCAQTGFPLADSYGFGDSGRAAILALRAP